MGYGRDEAWEEDPLEDRDMNLTVWTGADGTTYDVESMSRNHILNIIKLIHRRHFREEWLEEYGDDWLEVFKAELKRREANERA